MQQARVFKWTDDTYSMREFVDTFSHRLPVVIHIVDGRIGKTKDDEFSGAQTYRIAAVKRQRRIVARHTKGFYVAIPTRIKQKVNIFFPDGKEKHSATMRDVARALHDNIKGSVSMMFKDDQRFSFSFGRDESAELNFGQMTVIDVYEERFLVGHSVFEGKRTSPDVPLAIPIYAEVDVAIAIGLVGGTKEDFRKALAHMDDQMTNAVTDVSMADEIVLFPEDMRECEYERASPMATRYRRTASSGTGSRGTGSIGTAWRTSSAGTTPSPASSDKDKSLFDEVFTSEKTEDSDQSSYDDGFTPEKTERDKCRKKTRRRRKSDRLRPQSSLSSHTPTASTDMPGEPPLTRVRDSHPSACAVNNNVPGQISLRRGVVSTIRDRTRVAATNNNGSCENHHHVRSNTLSSQPLRLQESHSDVLSDIKRLNPDQLATCLQMLQMPEHCVDAFLNVNVDGELLMSIDESILIDEFKFSKCDALKLVKFAARGHRPTDM